MSEEIDATEDNADLIVPSVEEPLEVILHYDPVEEDIDEPIGELNDETEEPLIQSVGKPLRDLMLELAKQSAGRDNDNLDHLDHLDHLDNLHNLADVKSSGSLSQSASLASEEDRQKEAPSTIQEPINTKASLKTERKKQDKPARSIASSIKSTRQNKLSIISAGSNISKQSAASAKSKEKKRTKGSKVVTHKTPQAISPVSALNKSGITSDASIFSVPSPQAARSTSLRASRSSLDPHTPRSRSITQDSKSRLSKDANPNPMWGSLRKAKRRSSSRRSLNKLKKKPIDIFHPDDGSLSELSVKSDLSVSRNSDEEVEMIFKRNSLLEILRQIPDIDDLSEASLSSIVGTKRSGDDGQFVHPTWVGEGSFMNSPKPSQATTSAVEQVEEEYSSEIVSSTSHSLLSLDSLSDSVAEMFCVSARKLGEADEDDVAKTLNKIVVRNSQMDMIDIINRNLEIQRQAALEACGDFLDELVQRVVAYSDQEDVRLRRLLDKDKLIRALIPLVNQLSEEQLFRAKLEQRVTDHFVRKKQFVFVKTPKTFDALNYQRLQSSLVELDRLLEVHNQTFDLAQMQSIKATEELESARFNSDQKIHDFEQLVRTTLLANDSSIHLGYAVNEVLSSMSSFRDELSELRLELLYNQHRFAEMQIKSEVLEDLGDGLKMQEYLTQQSDVHVLGTKIAERNAELNRLHGKINFDLHALAHVKCKEHMCRQVCLDMKQTLAECEQSRGHHRALIYQGKLKHNQFLRELHKIRTSGSLMLYPSLLEDYDRTVKFLQLKRAAVEKLRCEYKRLNKRISMTESRLTKRRSTIRLSAATKLLGGPLIVTGFNITPTDL